jgi:CRP-like cAMP-binding protein
VLLRVPSFSPEVYSGRDGPIRTVEYGGRGRNLDVPEWALTALKGVTVNGTKSAAPEPLLTVTAFPGDGAARVLVSHENVTERKRVERIPGNEAAHAVVSRKNVAERKREGRLSGLEHKVAKGDTIANRLLAALPRRDYQGLLAGLGLVTLAYGEVLFEPGEPIRHVYFPNDSLVSLLTTVEGHQALEVGLVGREGMVGISLALGMDVSSVRALVQGTGTAMRMNAARFRREFRKSLPLQGGLYRFIHAKLAQARQTAACNRFHRVEARLTRWLLMTHDRVESDQFLLTQEFLADMLGVRRVAVTKAAGTLQQRKLISYSRGKIRILDRKGLEAASCGCYEVVKDLWDRPQTVRALARAPQRHTNKG